MSERKMKYLLLLALLITTSVHLKASVNYYFKQISTEQGLSQPWVRCVLNDSRGLIWIGTQSGLNIFDQYELKSYFYEKDSPTSLPDNQINFIMEDSLHTIWIGTEGGVVTFNRRENRFNPVMFGGKILKAYSYLFVSDGVLLGGEGELYKYSYSKPPQSIRKLDVINGVERRFKFNKLFGLGKDTYLVGSRYQGIFVYNVQSGSLDDCVFCTEKNNASVYVDSEKRIWISTFNKGVVCYSKDGRTLYQYRKSNSNLSNDIVLDIIERDSRMWLATDGGGINILNLDMKTFTVIENLPGDMYSLPVNSIYTLYNDNENNLWAGSIRNGLLNIRQVYAQTYRDVFQSSPYGLSNKSVISFFKDEQDILWIGTDGGGLNSYDYRTNRFQHIQSTYPEKVVSITSYSQDELILSFFSKGIFLFDKKSHKLSPFMAANEAFDRDEYTSGQSVYVNRCTKNKILFLAGKVCVYDKSDKKIRNVFSENEEQEKWLRLIESNDSASYLFGHHHIAKLIHRNNELETIVDLQEESLTTACLDNKGHIWIGTGTGLFMYDKKLHKIETNLFNNVSSLTSDNKGRIWIGAQNLLFCYDIEKRRFVILSESDGIIPNQLLHMPAVNDKSYIYLGGISGLVKISKNIRFEDDSQTMIKLMDVLVNGSSVIPKDDKREMRIFVPWDHTSLVVKLSVKEKDIFRKKIYRYQIVGLDREHTESYSHILNIRSLPPGDYSIVASCSTHGGGWSPMRAILSISVIPPWWKSTWFIILSIVFFVLGILMAVLFVIRKNKTKLRWEMKEYERKTYEEKISFLINVSHELRTPLTLIYAPLKRLLDGYAKDDYLNKQLTGIYKQARQMGNILNMVLDVRKMEVKQDTLQIIPHDLNEWLRLIADDFKNEFQAKDIELQYDFDNSVSEIPFDENKCEIIISNLMINALKFSDSQSTVILSTNRTSDGQYVRVSVSDQGIGLDNVDISKLFTRFYQGSHGRSGSGIGLSYSKMLIERHNGKMGALNKDNERGAIFFFELPILSLEQITISPRPGINELFSLQEQEKVKADPFDVSSYTLILVEDEHELREFLKDALLEHFKYIYTASNGEEALKVIYKNYPDIVVSDVMMPRMNGFELCKVIKENSETSHIPVILQTARNESESISIGYEIGADAYISKPFDVEFLLTIIRSQLRNRVQMKIRYKDGTMIETLQENISSNADEQFLIKLNALIVEHMNSPELNANFLASGLAMGRTSFYSKIKILTGMGLSEYINKLRVERAASLLSQTTLSITEIAEQTGFGYQTYFSSVFKLLKGVSPSKYRQDQERGMDAQ